MVVCRRPYAEGGPSIPSTEENAVNPIRTRFLAMALGVAAAMPLLSPAQAVAEEFPTRPIEVIVPFPPGGTSDLTARFLADRWSEFLGQPVIVVNKPGAASAVGASFVANAKPDGYTLLVASETSLLSVPTMQPDAGYDRNDFTYLFAYGAGAIVFSTQADAAWKTLPEFIEAAKASPGEMTYASYGIGTMGNFAAELLWREAGVDVTHIPYKSSPEANSAMLGGHVDLSVSSRVGAFADNDDVNILVSSAGDTMPYAPDIPTMKDFGFETSLSYLNIIVGPAGIPDDVKKKLVDAHKQAYEKYKDEIDSGLLNLEQTPVLIEGDEVAELMAEREQWFKDLAPQMSAAK
ncbi:tripartite tricarboxylate transporter substrate binding protein [Microbaculum marinum]|uniref:Tripartite tricarboxylate transporter substrate binding protein n=1 Tax=Microbaculum marinum TaxID=1764581 RepID=A0AAW9RVL0_9HYPH